MEDDFQEVGMFSSKVLDAGELMKIKRDHWHIENQLYHALDDSFREDRSPAKKSRNNLALIRKFAYNILKIAIARRDCCNIIPEAMDEFCDNHELM